MNPEIVMGKLSRKLEFKIKDAERVYGEYARAGFRFPTYESYETGVTATIDSEGRVIIRILGDRVTPETEDNHRLFIALRGLDLAVREWRNFSGLIDGYLK